jgi:hypothetical protein
MAVVQISRIQIRRGKAQNGTGIPQLASGELAWALDTQELYIGNGSVAEGAPAVGNTKVITELDLGVNGNILNLLTYIYKAAETGIQTGPTANSPIERGIQERLDDQINLKNFGVIGDGVADDTAAIQRAIWQLYANTNTTKASSNTFAGVRNRVVLSIPPGKYKITNTIYVPSYATLIGAGADKVIFEHTGTGPIIQFVNDNSSAVLIDTLNNSLYLTQPKGIIVSGISFVTASIVSPGLQLDAVRDSVFDNIIIKGVWNGQFQTATQNRGIWLRAKSALVTCERNTFRNITVEKFAYGVYTKQDIIQNNFDNFYITDTRIGIVLGGDNTISDGANGGSDGEQYGPRQTHFSNGRFFNVKHHALFLFYGTGNTITDVQLDNVGNNGGSHTTAEFPQMCVQVQGNTIQNVLSDRSHGKDSLGDLSIPIVALATVPFYPVITGVGNYQSYGTKVVNLSQITGYTLAFRLPVSTDQYSAPQGNISYSVNYLYESVASNFTRKGTFNIVADMNNGAIQYSDDYDFVGTDPLGNVSLALDFKAVFLDEIGDLYTGAGGQLPYSIAIQYTNPLAGDSGSLTYSYSATL